MTRLSSALKPLDYEDQGRALAQKLHDKIPIIYASSRNQALARNWKIKFNETGKIPAFCNVLPELNHNEMTGFDATPATKQLSSLFHFIFLKDAEDHPRIIKRMETLKKLYNDRGLAVETIELNRQEIFHKIFSCLVLADWTAYYLAKSYGVEPEQVPMVEEFKRLIA